MIFFFQSHNPPVFNIYENAASEDKNKTRKEVAGKNGKKCSVLNFILAYVGILFLLAIVAMLIYLMVRMNSVDSVSGCA